MIDGFWHEWSVLKCTLFPLVTGKQSVDIFWGKKVLISISNWEVRLGVRVWRSIYFAVNILVLSEFLCSFLILTRASLVAQLVKNPPAMRETWVWSLGREDPLEKGKATHSSILAWRNPCPWCCKELDMTEWLSFTHFQLSWTGIFSQ